MKADRPLPVVVDRETAGFFEAARRGEVGIKVCSDCGHGLHVPIARCNRCGSWSTSWQAVRGSGTLYSWTTVTHQVHPAFPTPYTLVLVQLDDLPEVRMLGTVPADTRLEVGLPMEVWFEDLSDEITIPQWRPREGPK